MHEFKFKSQNIKTICFQIFNLISNKGGVAYLVGGCVRDNLMQLPAKDIDIEIYGLELNKLINILKEKFSINYVGKSFGVIKLNHYPIDISIPRTEQKTSQGYTGFKITTNHNYEPKEACARRDFTINAILYNPLNDKYIDPFNGYDDLKKKILRHTTKKFIEDPLRVLRSMQFLARFDFTISRETLELCKQIKIENLSRERIFEEWKKLILKGKKISAGLQFLHDCNWLQYFPKLADLVNCQQHKKWHPEGDVFTHTGLCMDAFAVERDLVADEKENLLVGLGVLCHDLGKPLTTKLHPDGSITSHRHDLEGIGPTNSFLSKLTNQKDILKEVSLLVKYHMIPHQLYQQQVSNAAILRFSNKVGNIKRLLRVCKADYNGRSKKYKSDYPAGNWLLEKANNLKISKKPPEHLLKGRHLIKLGLKPSKKFSTILEIAYQAQLNGEINSQEEAIELIQKKQII